ncbi:division/cell wall cluster transcriptional repressor MraZ [Cochlodiniinecator piscidefendens]|uniref:division/cell wall cluster transcriptional repressor MraZ n=1 Tax=Cochlodiniinecator piscidefendens TaxID=2715756 RepID=UPI00140CF4F3
MVRSFRGESLNKVDTKGRMSIPASFRRVLEAGDPNWETGKQPELVIVYGGKNRRHLECFTIEAILDVERRILKMPRGSKKRKALQTLYSTQATTTSVDDTGRLVLPAKLREKIGLDGNAFFAGKLDTFEIWNPETYDDEMFAGLDEDDDFDPDADASIYLDGEEDE